MATGVLGFGSLQPQRVLPYKNVCNWEILVIFKYLVTQTLTVNFLMIRTVLITFFFFIYRREGDWLKAQKKIIRISKKKRT